jgi:GGDEF domain-containing protein
MEPERFREMVRAQQNRLDVTPTVSVGAASIGAQSGDLIRIADAALYGAKRPLSVSGTWHTVRSLTAQGFNESQDQLPTDATRRVFSLAFATRARC